MTRNADTLPRLTRDGRKFRVPVKVHGETAPLRSYPVLTDPFSGVKVTILVETLHTDAENQAALHRNRVRHIVANGIGSIHTFDRPDGKRVICEIRRTGVYRETVEILDDLAVLPIFADLFGDDWNTRPEILSLISIAGARIKVRPDATDVKPAKGTAGGRPKRQYHGITIFSQIPGKMRAEYEYQSRLIKDAGYTGRKDPRYLADLSAVVSAESPQHSWARQSVAHATQGNGRR